MKNISRITLHITLLLLLFTVVLTGCNKVPSIDWEVKITGAVSKPLTLTFNELTLMDQRNLNDVFMSRTYGEDEYRSFSGIPLEDLLTKAEASKDMVSITALAADGYAIEIPLADLQDGILALKDGGDWIVNKEPESGPMRLVFPKTPASSWVFQIIEIQVNK